MAQQNSSEEIDIGYLFKKSNDFFKSVVRSLFLVLDFFIKYYIIVLVLLIIGFAYGYYKDSTEVSVYSNEVIVIPNFESVDYLYGKVEAINNKISAGDTIFLKQVVDSNFRKLNGLKIEPFVDIYNFVSESNRNFDVLRLISEKKDLFEYMEDPSIIKYYKYHRLQINIKGSEASKEMVADLLAYLNDNEHLKRYQSVYKENNAFEIQEYHKMIAQVDSVLRANSEIAGTASNVSITNSADLFNLVEKKIKMLDDLLVLKTQTLDFEKPIKLVSADYNLKTKRFLSLSNKLKYPLLLVFLFSMVFFVIYLFKKLRRYSHLD